MIIKTNIILQDKLSNIYLQSDIKKITWGIVMSLFMSGSVILSACAFPGNQFIALITVIIIPFIFIFLISKNIIDSLTIVWLNEIFFGVGGTWITLGPLPGRGFLLLIVLFMYITLTNVRIKKNGTLDRTSFIILFYGLFFPFILFLYGTIVGGAKLANALSDVIRFGTVLIYFPMRDLFRRNFDLFFGWIIGATIILSLLFVTMAIAPNSIRIPLIVNWSSGGNIDSVFNRPDLEFIRAAMTPMILCFIGVFLGIMYATDSKKTIKKQILGLLLALCSIAPYIINFVRGSILGIFLSILTILLLSVIHQIQWTRFLRIIIISSFTLFVGYWISVNYIPISLTKWVIPSKDLSDIVNPIRIEQTNKMIEAWLDEPIFGKGVGVPVNDYSRDGGEGLAFEVQFPMVLYRVGLSGFIIIMIPFGWLIIRTMQIWSQKNIYLESYIGKLQMAIGLSTISLLSASWTNPYFASVMSPLFVVLFLSLDKISIHYQNS